MSGKFGGGGAASGSVATDTIWDAAGDLAVGSGANTAAKLTKGNPGQVLLPNASTLAWTGSPHNGGLGPTDSLAENFSRLRDMSGSPGTSGTLRMVAFWLPAGLTVTSIGVVCGTTGEAGGSHAWAALYDSARALLRQSTNETGAAAVAGSSAHDFTLTSTFVTTYSGLHYVGVNVVASTMPSLFSLSAGNAILLGVAPILAGNTSDTGLTSTAPSNAGTITAAATPFYCYVK